MNCEDCEQPIKWTGGRCTECDPYEIEYCTNVEWLVVFGGYDADDSCDGSEPSDEARKLMQREFEAVEAVGGVTLSIPGRGRGQLHGWNGAHFRWSMAQFGSFEKLPEPLRLAIENAIEAVA